MRIYGGALASMETVWATDAAIASSYWSQVFNRFLFLSHERQRRTKMRRADRRVTTTAESICHRFKSIDSDIDCTNAARLLMRMQADLVLFIEKRQRLKSKATA